METTPFIAEVAVSVATYHLDKLYDYMLPEDMRERAKVGMRVTVPYGRGNKAAEGVILSFAQSSDFDEVKSVISLNDELIFDRESIKLALWMRERFFCTVYDAFKCMIPAKTVFKRKYKKRAVTAQEIPKDRQATLNDEQQSVFDDILPLIYENTPKAALLYGVTGSGKTLIYIKLIDVILQQGRTAIVLVPEIVLTPQTVSIFESHFGDKVAVLHSRLGEGERYFEWKRIRDGSVSVVVGTRSAVFAPLSNIGLIVIDEEQEHTYKSETSPRYHARDIAKYRITRSSGLLLLSSATPSVDSMYAAVSGKYTLFRLNNRYSNTGLPSVILADMKTELKNGNGGQISSILRHELEQNINAGEQSILFINRRGANTAVACGECGYTYTCRDCSVSMTYHSVNRSLLCHYCGYSIPVQALCPECGGKLKFIGAGTQKVEQELLQLFPGINLIRMDADTTTRKDSHFNLLREFRESKAPILLGTQMVTKGLDFENVTLVGVLNADLSLYVSDYRANETTFSLITQVVGRGGRGDKPGRAVIQTFAPRHKTIEQASRQDYDAFYESEISLRQALNVPPVYDLLSVTAVGNDNDSVIAVCDELKRMLALYFAGNAAVELLGPAPAAIPKIKNKYFRKIMIKCKNDKHVRSVIAHVICQFHKSKNSRNITVYADTE